ncbi:MAG TPA: GNAT family N-acetyltransferase [Bryobacteraceae bacterium]
MSQSSLRLAVPDDIPAIEALIAASVNGLHAGDYTAEQRAGALGSVFGVDRQLIRDGTYFVIETSAELGACGGWSRRRTLFGSDNVAGKDDAFLDPALDAARIRAFFVHPDWARRGFGSQLLEAGEQAARAAGFARLELGATLTGIPLYERHGFKPLDRSDVPLPNGATLPIVRMSKELTSSATPPEPAGDHDSRA